MTDREAVNGEGVVEQEEAPAGTRIFKGQLFRVRNGKRWGFRDEAPAPAPESVRTPARVAQTLVFAHRLEVAIEAGEYADQADAARKLGLTRARISQLLALTRLAPDIQEELLFLEAVDGREPMGDRALRDVVRHEGWTEQRAVWMDRAPASPSYKPQSRATRTAPGPRSRRAAS